MTTETALRPLKAPFPWFGGKRLAAPLIWSRFGNVGNYVEPFAGSLATLLCCPHTPGNVTVNDKDAYIANFWRALQADPDAVARYADWPVSEVDLEARHRWLVSTGAHRIELLKNHADYFDAKVAGWWVWGLSQWIGARWCNTPKVDGDVVTRIPKIGGIGGVHRKGFSGEASVPCKIPDVGPPNGIHRASLQDVDVPAKRPRLATKKGCNAQRAIALSEYFQELAERLRHVRVVCGDWSRVLSPCVIELSGVNGIMLDPPYGVEDRHESLYSEDDLGISAAVRAWAIEHGENPRLRIALCGYDGEHEMPENWECVSWKAGSGYASVGETGNQNRHRERIWFSPHCLKPHLEPELF